MHSELDETMLMAGGDDWQGLISEPEYYVSWDEFVVGLWNSASSGIQPQQPD